ASRRHHSFRNRRQQDPPAGQPGRRPAGETDDQLETAAPRADRRAGRRLGLRCCPDPAMQLVMQMLRYRPAAPLSAFIDQFWYVRGYDPDRKRQSALPTGSIDLTFNLAADDLWVFADAADRVGLSFDGAVVHGAQSRYFVLDARRDVHVIGVHFRPGGGAALLGVNAQELTDRHVALSDIWGERAHTLRAQLLEAPTPAAKFGLLEREVLALTRPRPRV